MQRTFDIRVLLAEQKERAPEPSPCTRPLILVPGLHVLTQAGQRPLYGSDASSMNVLRQVGGWPVSLACLPLFQGDPLDVFMDEAIFEKAFDSFWSVLMQMDAHGLCVTGGGDLFSSLYEQCLPVPTAKFDLWRDLWERYLLLIARLLRWPTFGIGRGMQHMNIIMRGRLVQGLRAQWPEKDMPALLSHQPRGRLMADNYCKHALRLHPRSRLAMLVQRDPGAVTLTIDEVLSMHQQAVGYVMPNGRVAGFPAPKQRIAAVAFDGVIEALEDSDPKIFWLGVQFHPEWAEHLAWVQNLFHGFVKECRAYVPLTREQLEEHKPTIQAWVRAHDLPLTAKTAPQAEDLSEITFLTKKRVKRSSVQGLSSYKHSKERLYPYRRARLPRV